MLYDLAAGQGTRCKEAAGFAAVRAAAVSPGLTLTLSLSLSLTLTLTLTRCVPWPCRRTVPRW